MSQDPSNGGANASWESLMESSVTVRILHKNTYGRWCIGRSDATLLIRWIDTDWSFHDAQSSTIIGKCGLNRSTMMMGDCVYLSSHVGHRDVNQDCSGDVNQHVWLMETDVFAAKELTRCCHNPVFCEKYSPVWTHWGVSRSPFSLV